MKMLHSLRFNSVLISLLLTGQVFSQDFTSYNEERPLPRFLLKSEAANYPEVSAPALLAFKKMFSNINDVRWSIVENKYMARFTHDGRLNRILFDKKGHVVYSITEGTVKNLPADIRKAVRSIYYDYDITKASEVHTLDKTAWFINLEDETSHVTVKVFEGEVIETGFFRKSK